MSLKGVFGRVSLEIAGSLIHGKNHDDEVEHHEDETDDGHDACELEVAVHLVIGFSHEIAVVAGKGVIYELLESEQTGERVDGEANDNEVADNHRDGDC